MSKMNVKKGTILYHYATGRPSVVTSVRTLNKGTSMEKIRVRLSTGNRFDFATWLPDLATWVDVQTPELARKWARALKREAANQAFYQEKRRQFAQTRLANRDQLNAPPHISSPAQNGEDGVSDVCITVTGVVQDALGEIVPYVRHYGVSVDDHNVGVIGEDGEYIYTRQWAVNWSALGNQSTEVARAYAHAILAAADLADERNVTHTTTTTEV